MSTACNVYDGQASEFACETQANCTAPRMCVMNFCVLSSSTPDADLDAPRPADADLDAPDSDPDAPDARMADATPLADAPPGSITLIRKIQAGTDDAEEDIMNGNMQLLSFDLDLILDVNKDQIVGLRFTNITIPQGATIFSAHIQFTVDETDSSLTTLQFFAEDIDNAPTFSSTSGNISARTKTTASASWSPVAWSPVGAAGADQLTPNLASVAQEVISRGGWQNGNSLVFLITGSGQRTAEAFDDNALLAPELTIQYQP